jgi:Flp pilus assembly protein TadD
MELARLLANRSKWGPALQEAQAALRLNPGDVEVHEVLARCFLALGNQSRAREETAIVENLRRRPKAK